jgi:hypothetical protein
LDTEHNSARERRKIKIFLGTEESLKKKDFSDLVNEHTQDTAENTQKKKMKKCGKKSPSMQKNLWTRWGLTARCEGVWDLIVVKIRDPQNPNGKTTPHIGAKAPKSSKMLFGHRNRHKCAVAWLATGESVF